MLPRKLMLRDGVRRSAVVPTSKPLTSASKLNECERFVIELGFIGARSWREGLKKNAKAAVIHLSANKFACQWEGHTRHRGALG